MPPVKLLSTTRLYQTQLELALVSTTRLYQTQLELALVSTTRLYQTQLELALAVMVSLKHYSFSSNYLLIFNCCSVSSQMTNFFIKMKEYVKLRITYSELFP